MYRATAAAASSFHHFRPNRHCCGSLGRARRFMAHRSVVGCTVLRAQAQLTLGACATQQTTDPQRATINRGALGR